MKSLFFELIEDEWKDAVAKYKSLTPDSGVNYMSRTVTATITIGLHAHFDNETTLNQFERLFQMLEFKREHKNHAIEVVVDNARTHTTKSYSLLDVGKNIDT